MYARFSLIDRRSSTYTVLAELSNHIYSWPLRQMIKFSSSAREFFKFEDWSSGKRCHQGIVVFSQSFGEVFHVEYTTTFYGTWSAGIFLKHRHTLFPYMNIGDVIMFDTKLLSSGRILKKKDLRRRTSLFCVYLFLRLFSRTKTHLREGGSNFRTRVLDGRLG